MIVPCLNAFALSGRVNIICCGITQGVASLALGLCAPLGLQLALAKFET